MRRVIAILLVLASGALAGSIYSWLSEPAASPQERTMEWLRHELALTDVQYERIRSLHRQRCPEIHRVSNALATPGGHQTCARLTAQLMSEVCAELTPAQCDKYVKLVERCRRKAASSP